MISIIIPHYNSPKLLGRLLDSINYNIDTEVIVIDDKSDQYIDEYKSIKENEKNENVIFIDNTSQTKSAGKCRNIGLQMAKGKWILFADADDCFVNGYTKKLLKYLKSEFEVVFFAPTSINLNTLEKSHRHFNSKKIINRYLEVGDEAALLLLKYKIPEPWSKLIRRDFLEKHKLSFDETIAANDRMFSTKVSQNMENFTASKDIIYCVTFCKGSLTNNLSKKVFETRMNVYIEYYHYVKKRVTKKQFKILNISGRKFIFKSLLYNYGFWYTVGVCRYLIKNRIRFLDWRLLNPFRIIRYSIKALFEYLRNSNYYIKD